MIPIAPIPDKDSLYLIGTVRLFVSNEKKGPHVRLGGDKGFQPLQDYCKANDRHFKRTITEQIDEDCEYTDVVENMIAGKALPVGKGAAGAVQRSSFKNAVIEDVDDNMLGYSMDNGPLRVVKNKKKEKLDPNCIQGEFNMIKEGEKATRHEGKIDEVKQLKKAKQLPLKDIQGIVKIQVLK